MRCQSCTRYRGRSPKRVLVCEQTLEHADRRVKRRSYRAPLRFAVPAAIGKLLAQQSIDERVGAFAKVCGEGYDATVDARLDLALEEARAAELRRPAHIVAHTIDRTANALVRRID